MYHIQFEKHDTYRVAILAKTDALREGDIKSWYINPMVTQGIPYKDFIAFRLEYGGAKKPSAAVMKEYLQNDHLPELKALVVETLY